MKKNILITMQHIVYGGVEKMLFATLNAVDYDKYTVTLLLWHNEHQLEDCINPSVKVVYVSEDKNPWSIRLFRLFPHFYKKKLLKQRFDIEILYRHDWAHAYFNFWDRDSKRYVFIHGDMFYHTDFKQFLTTGKGKIIKALQSSVFKNATKMIAVSENTRESFEDYWTQCKGKTLVINNAVDVAAIRASARETTEDYGDYFVTVSRLDKNKNVIDILKAFQKIKQAFPTYHLVVVGDGSTRPELEKYVKDNALDGEVYFTGAVPNPYAYIAKAKLLLFASIEEAFGLVAVESISLGIPVVSYNNRGVVNLGSGGIVVVSMDIDSMAVAVQEILSDEEYYNRLVTGGLMLAEKFDVSILKESINGLLAE